MKLFFFTCSIVFAIVACNPEPKTDTFQPFEFKDSLDIELTQFLENQIIPGFAVAVVNENGILFQKTYGYSDLENKTAYQPNTRQIIASVSKTFIGVALMKLVDQGKINLDDPINKYLPFEIKNPKHPNIDITIRMLATHTSSIDDYDDGDESTFWLIDPIPEPRSEIPAGVLSRLEYFEKGAPSTLAQSIAYALSKEGKWYDPDNFYDYEPGTTNNYSNIGSSLAAYIVERASGQSFEDYTKEYIFQPLNMSNTTWGHIDNDKHLSTMYTTYEINETSQTYALPRYQWGDYADGGLITNLLDLSEYVEEMINGMIGEGKILSKQSYIQLFTPQLNKTHFPDGRDESIYNDGYNYSIFWGLDFEGNAGALILKVMPTTMDLTMALQLMF